MNCKGVLLQPQYPDYEALGLQGVRFRAGFRVYRVWGTKSPRSRVLGTGGANLISLPPSNEYSGLLLWKVQQPSIPPSLQQHYVEGVYY